MFAYRVCLRRPVSFCYIIWCKRLELNSRGKLWAATFWNLWNIDNCKDPKYLDVNTCFFLFFFIWCKRLELNFWKVEIGHCHERQILPGGTFLFRPWLLRLKNISLLSAVLVTSSKLINQSQDEGEIDLLWQLLLLKIVGSGFKRFGFHSWSGEVSFPMCMCFKIPSNTDLC